MKSGAWLSSPKSDFSPPTVGALLLIVSTPSGTGRSNHTAIASFISAERPLLYPRFAPGDALFFDHYNLHRTGTGPADSGFRYAVESWFFAASTAPAKQQPLVL